MKQCERASFRWNGKRKRNFVTEAIKLANEVGKWRCVHRGRCSRVLATDAKHSHAMISVEVQTDRKCFRRRRRRFRCVFRLRVGGRDPSSGHPAGVGAARGREPELRNYAILLPLRSGRRTRTGGSLANGLNSNNWFVSGLVDGLRTLRKKCDPNKGFLLREEMAFLKNELRRLAMVVDETEATLTTREELETKIEHLKVNTPFFVMIRRHFG